MKPFWEDEYLNEQRSTFGQPSPEVGDLVPRLPADARILDVGCGDGRHALYLAGLGFPVDAFDVSENAIQKLDLLKEQRHLAIHTRVCDVLDFDFQHKYDLIIIHGVLQFIDRAKQPGIIALLKEWTCPGGYHIIALFTDEVPVPDDLKDVMIGVYRNEEIKEHYADWDVCMFERKIFHDEHENGVRHCHAMNKLVARKAAMAE